MRAYKEHKYIIFELDDGKTVKYDLSNGETIGKLGKPVKSLNSQLSGHNVYSVIESFEDKNYSKFLRFVLKYFINNSRDMKYRYSGRHCEVDRVKNIGTFLSRMGDYSFFEQYFAAGIHNISPDLTIKLSDIPKNLVKLCKLYELKLSSTLLEIYNNDPDLFTAIMSLDCLSLTQEDRYKVLEDSISIYYNRNAWKTLIKDYNYNPISLLKYVDNLMTYEAIAQENTLRELLDYCNMMKQISPKYDKYPKNFLTTHQIASRNYRRLKATFDEEQFQDKIDPTLEWKNDKHEVIYPKTVQDIKDEAVQQNNCVASYIDKVIRGECHIVFLRKSDEIESSLVTLEIRNDMVVQAKGAFNRDINTEESMFIEKYNKHLNRQRIRMNNNIVVTEEMMIC